MVTQYNAIVMASSPVPGLGSHDMEVTSNDKFSFLLLCQPEWISIIVHSKLPEDQQCSWPTRRRYTEADMEALVSKILECPITETVVFGELWKRRLKAQMISLEEGVLEHWFFGRIILAGDAIHKVFFNLSHNLPAYGLMKSLSHVLSGYTKLRARRKHSHRRRRHRRKYSACPSCRPAEQEAQHCRAARRFSRQISKRPLRSRAGHCKGRR
jgi:hypothetical protein